MRKDKGLSGELDRLPTLTWIMFLKFLDDLERQQETKAILRGEPFRPIVEPPYRWRDWAAEEKSLSGDDLIAFINNDEAIRPDGQKGAGLLAYLRRVDQSNHDPRRRVVATVFRGVINRMINGYLLRDVVNKINDIHFDSSEEIHTLSHFYETMLREMRDAAGDSGEFYTPRPVVQFMVTVTDPRLGEIVYDPAAGTGGFLVEAFTHLEKQVKTVEDKQVLHFRSIRGGEAKPLPYLLAQMNLLLHGLESPEIDPANSLRHKLTDLGDRERVDVILTNPPFGGEEQQGIVNNFPRTKQTAETALLFLQLIMRLLRRPTQARDLTGFENLSGLPGDKPGRAAVVVPNGTLFADGVAARIKEQLLTEFNLHTIVRLPNGVFAPYTSIPTNLLFFDASGPTETLWYYELPLSEGRKQYTKTKPLTFEEFGDCLAWWHNRHENEHAWVVNFKQKYSEAKAKAEPHWQAAAAAEQRAADCSTAARKLEDHITGLEMARKANPGDKAKLQADIETLQAEKKQCLAEEQQQRELARAEQAAGDALYWPIYNLDSKNPNAADTIEHMPPEQLVADIIHKERQILALMEEVEQALDPKGLKDL
jgi:type I restriction enzyme M protein